MIPAAWKEYEGRFKPEELTRKAEELGTAGKLPDSSIFTILTPEDKPEYAGIKGLGIGFHGTDQPMEVVAGAKGTATPMGEAWGGLQKPHTFKRFQDQWSLDAPWNLVKAFMGGNKAYFRGGKNKDNELLSMISIGTRANPCIKFPDRSWAINQPDGTTWSDENWVYAAVIEEGYPTFAEQVNAGKVISADPFLEPGHRSERRRPVG